MLDGKSLINLPRLLFSKFQLISHVHTFLMGLWGISPYSKVYIIALDILVIFYEQNYLFNKDWILAINTGL